MGFFDTLKKDFKKAGADLEKLAGQAENELNALGKQAETKINNTSAEDVGKGIGALTARAVKIGGGCFATVKAGYEEEKAKRPDAPKTEKQDKAPDGPK